jgi:glucose/mannose-6-phosphate isomerase
MSKLKEIISYEDIINYDRSNILNDFRNWPKLSLEAFEKPIAIKKISDYKNIVFCGMGGSAASCDVIKDWIGDINITIVRNYHLPRWVNVKDLVVAVSYSGNTEETLSCYSEALKKSIPMVTISSGGLLESSSKKNSIPHNKVTSGLVPRAAFPPLFYTLVRILHSMGIVNDEKFKEAKSSVQIFTLLSKSIFPETSFNQNISKQVASFIHNKFPVVYGSEGIKSVVERFRKMICEMGKWHAMADTIPEMCHNEIVSYDLHNPMIKIILLRTRSEASEVSVRFDILKSILSNSKQKFMELQAPGENYLENVVSYFYLLDVSTVYLAIMNKVDPSKTKSIDVFKNQLEKKLQYVEKLFL